MITVGFGRTTKGIGTAEIAVALSRQEFIDRIPEVGRQIVGLFFSLPLEDIQSYTTKLMQRAVVDKNTRVTNSDIPPVVNDLAIEVGIENGYKRRGNHRMVGSARLFGTTHRHSGAHIDTNFDSRGEQMPLLGTWLQFTGNSLMSLAQIPSFETDAVSKIVEDLRIDTDDPDFEKRVKIRSEKIDKFSTIEVFGPSIGVWTIGKSEEKNIFTTLHQVETIGEEPRISTTLIQNYTDRIY